MKPVHLALGCLCTAAASAQVDRIDGRPFATRSAVLGQHGMVCTSQPLATHTATKTMRIGSRVFLMRQGVKGQCRRSR